MNNPAVAVYDPSFRAKGGTYWQWTNSDLNPSWDNAACLINRGWPERVDMSSTTVPLDGAIRHKGSTPIWIYRIYPAGRDEFGRPGRYFFVLFRLDTLADMLNRHVSGVLDYFDTKRDLPLKTEPLCAGLPECPPEDSLVKIMSFLREAQGSGHWGFDRSGLTTELPFEELAPNGHHSSENDVVPSNPSTDSQKKKAPVIGSSVVVPSGVGPIISHAHSNGRMPDTAKRQMHWIKRIGLAIIILIAMWAMYGHRYKQGFADGYGKGEEEGFADGHTKGKEEGNREIFEKGERKGGSCQKCGRDKKCPDCDKPVTTNGPTGHPDSSNQKPPP